MPQKFSGVDSYWEIVATSQYQTQLKVRYFKETQSSMVVRVRPYIKAEKLADALEAIRLHIYNYDLSEK